MDDGPEIGPGSVAGFYEAHDESVRLDFGVGRVELLRTQELLRAALPPARARVLDVGGADGVHAAWLKEDGYDVEIVDVVPLHVDRARVRGFAAQLGDARSLAYDDRTVDVVLLLGPLYHLPDRSERMKALREAHRVLRRGGFLAAAAVSRMAVPIDWLRDGSFAEPQGKAVARRIAATGSDDTGSGAGVFYFHTVAELEHEARDAGFEGVVVRGIEGPAWPLVNHTCPPDDPLVSDVIEVARLADLEEATVGASAHLLALARA
ncbi:MAG: class I SAM-dependent methyltransferase [Acidimicrobiia bacterium]